MYSKIVNEYTEYRDKIGNRESLYKAVQKEFSIKSALYPGSHIDIAPSLVIPNVIYVDNFKKTIAFFKNMDSIKQFINENKKYPESCSIDFLGQDYTNELHINQVDLIISQYAGFVGQATKKYLKSGGILLCNDSHGDATMAKFDNEFEFLGVIGRNNKFTKRNLEEYFVLSKNTKVDLIKVKEKMKGPKYKLMTENYIFRKL